MAHSLDFYRGFDEQFFYDEDRKKSSDKYKSFLERHQSLLIPLLVTPEIIESAATGASDIERKFRKRSR